VIGGSKTATDRFFSGFRQGLRELGYLEGRDYDIEVRYADGDIGRVPSLTEELLGLKPDVIVSGTTAGVLAASKLTNAVPIVSEVLTDPVGFWRRCKPRPAWRECDRRAGDSGGYASQAP
jgi:putative ABC transport system substrate-binding protein